jgi:hypothetical protein
VLGDGSIRTGLAGELGIDVGSPDFGHELTVGHRVAILAW